MSGSGASLQSGATSSKAPASTPPVVVIGPRTRLGRELITRARCRGETVWAVARHQRDADYLAAAWGHDAGVVIVLSEARATDKSASAAQQPDSNQHPTPPPGAKVFICALGPVQSEDRVDDPDVVLAEIATLKRLLRGGGARVVLVSSVLALAAKPDRRHYAGWKCLIEEWVRQAAEEHGAAFSVLFPGRLVEGSQEKWRRILHTPYPKLAGVVEQSSDRAHSKSVGLDARLWLLARGAGLASGALTVQAA